MASPGPNTAGTPKTTDYNLGRGVVYLAPINASGYPQGWRDLGNTLSFKSNVTIEELIHRSSRAGLKTIDKKVTVSQDIQVSFECDELNFENFALFFSGTQDSFTNPAVAGFSEWVMVPDGELALGRWYDIKNSSHVRAYDITASDVTVKTNEGSPVTLVLNTDYTIDATMGRIFIKATSTAAATSISGGKGLKVTLAAKAGAVTPISRVKGLTISPATYALKFVSENPTNANQQTEFMFFQVTVTPDGDLEQIGDDWSKMGFKGAVEINTTLNRTLEVVRPLGT